MTHGPGSPLLSDRSRAINPELCHTKGSSGRRGLYAGRSAGVHMELSGSAPLAVRACLRASRLVRAQRASRAARLGVLGASTPAWTMAHGVSGRRCGPFRSAKDRRPRRSWVSDRCCASLKSLVSSYGASAPRWPRSARSTAGDPAVAAPGSGDGKGCRMTLRQAGILCSREVQLAARRERGECSSLRRRPPAPLSARYVAGKLPRRAGTSAWPVHGGELCSCAPCMLRKSLRLSTARPTIAS